MAFPESLARISGIFFMDMIDLLKITASWVGKHPGDVLTVICTVLGIIVGAWFVLRIEYARRPTLKFHDESVDAPWDYEKEGRAKATGIKCALHLQLRISNKDHNRFLKHWLRREVATHCRAYVTFHFEDSRLLAAPRMNARWGSDPVQPLTLKIMDEHHQDTGCYIFDRNLYVKQHLVDIIPGHSEYIDIVPQFDDEQECFGWNNESYLFNWRHPRRTLFKGNYLVEVTVVSDKSESRKIYQLINVGHRWGLELEYHPEQQDSMLFYTEPKQK